MVVTGEVGGLHDNSLTDRTTTEERNTENRIFPVSLPLSPCLVKDMQITEQQKLIWSFAFYSSCVLDVVIILETYSRLCQTTATMCSVSRQADIFLLVSVTGGGSSRG